MKQNVYIAALLAGMLALAGCGGGGSGLGPDAVAEKEAAAAATAKAEAEAAAKAAAETAAKAAEEAQAKAIAEALAKAEADRKAAEEAAEAAEAAALQAEMDALEKAADALEMALKAAERAGDDVTDAQIMAITDAHEALEEVIDGVETDADTEDAQDAYDGAGGRLAAVQSTKDLATEKAIALPTGYSTNDVRLGRIGLGNSGDNTPITIPAGDKRTVDGVVFSCPAGGSDCMAVFKNELGTLVVMSTGGLTAANPSTTVSSPPDTTLGTNPQPTVSTDPLSNDVLLEALKATGSEVTVWSAANTSIDKDQPVSYKPLSGPKITLRIMGDTEAYWGRWVESRLPEAVLGSPAPTDAVDGDRGIVWGGSTPYGKKPDDSITTATYGGSAENPQGNVLLYYSKTGKVDSWNEGMGMFSLTADFSKGMVGGSIAIAKFSSPVNVISPATDENITLMPTAIDGSGTFSGAAKFASTEVTGQNGNWNGGFFGETTKVESSEQKHKAPSHAAGQFSVSRGEVKPDDTVTQDALHIRGAFGSACNPACP